ncbi:MAG: hypothetical protein LBF22_11260 [Deltaproteobacteria bacterium]|jgi:hypothetical protein|nr:hypothetical protein [Deltaproteobacteria bacterium]
MDFQKVAAIPIKRFRNNTSKELTLRRDFSQKLSATIPQEPRLASGRRLEGKKHVRKDSGNFSKN